MKYNKILFRENRGLQTKELMDLQEVNHFFLTPGLKKGGKIEILNGHIYIEEALFSMYYEEGLKTFLIPSTKLVLNQGSYYLSITERVIESERDLLNPLTGGPFIGAQGNPRLVVEPNYTLDTGDIQVFTVEADGSILKTPLFSLEDHTNKALLEEIGSSHIDTGLEAYIESDKVLVLTPGVAFIDGITYQLDLPIRLELSEDKTQILSLTRDGPLLKNEELVDLESLTVKTIGEDLVVSNTLSNVVIDKYHPHGKSLDLYRITKDPLSVESLVYKTPIENFRLDDLKYMVLKQREEINRLSLNAGLMSRTGFNVNPNQASDRSHPLFLSTETEQGVTTYLKELKVQPLGSGIDMGPALVEDYLTQSEYGEYEDVVPSTREPWVETIPTYVPSFDCVYPESLYVSIKSGGLEPQKDYYLGLNGVPNYSSPIRSDIGGEITTDITLGKNLLPPSISIWDKEEQILERTLGVEPNHGKHLPAYNYIGEKIQVVSNTNLYSIQIRLDSLALPNLRVASVYICDTSFHVLGRASISSKGIGSEAIFEEPIYVIPGTYYILIAVHIEGVKILLSSSQESNMITYRNGYLEEDMNKSLFYILKSINNTGETGTISINGDNPLLDASNVELNESTIILNGEVGGPIPLVRLDSSYIFSREYQLPSSWVSRQWSLGKPYKSLKIKVITSSTNIEVYSSPNHKNWDKASIASIREIRGTYEMEYEISYPDIYYLEGDSSVPRTKVSILIDMEEVLTIYQVGFISVF